MKPGIRCNTVVFDCDSTLCDLEGIEFIAHGHEAEIARLTDLAMSGAVALEEVYGRRLELVRPTRAQLRNLSQAYIDGLVPDARETVAALQSEGVRVCIVSGGLAPAVHAVAEALGVATADVAAVDVYFDAHGEYAGFDGASPLARAGGKTDVLRAWREVVPAPIMLVGDGATDLEARPAVDVFVAFAGVVERAPVVAAADAVVRARSLAPVLPLALGGARPRDAGALPLFDRGVDLLAARRSGD